MRQITRLILLASAVYVTRVSASFQPEPNHNPNGRTVEVAQPADVRPPAVTHQQLSITVDFDMVEGEQGVLVMASNESEGFVVYVENGRALFRYQRALDSSALVVSSATLRPGHVRLRYEFDADTWTNWAQRGRGHLWVNDSEATIEAGVISDARVERDDPVLGRSFTGAVTGVTVKEN